MKKIFYLAISLFFLFATKVDARDTIYSINMDIYLDKSGNANITEVWDVKADGGTEWFKQIENMGNSNISNFTVYMDNAPLTYKEWNIGENLEQKKGYYGINKIEDGIELCFGKADFNRHTFRFSYTLSNFVFNTNDSQILIWRLVNKTDANFSDFKIIIRSYYQFPDSLDVWATGYKGLAYVKDGIITISNEDMDKMTNDSYVVALVKFPLNTFETENAHDTFKSFEDVQKAYSEGTYAYDEMTTKEKIIMAIAGCSFLGGMAFLINYIVKRTGYGYIDNKTINKKDTPNFRDIPCDKDIFYANALMKLNSFGYTETNIFGALILKWVKENKIDFIKKENQGLLKNKEESILDLRKKNTFTNSNEEKLFNAMYEASEDGLLEKEEFVKWSRNNADRFLKIFTSFYDDTLNELKKKDYIYKRRNKAECKYYNVMNDKIYEDSKRLLGLKKFLEEFSNMKERETIEVHIWDEYLMFAYLFGIADKVYKQLKNLYPEVIEKGDIDSNTMMMAHDFSTHTVSSAISAARNYSAGGGGFSTGGGGGGSFGGGFSGGR